MQGVDLSKPGEKKKLIGAGVLGLAAIVVLYWALIGFDSGSSNTVARPAPTPAQQSPRGTQASARNTPAATTDILSYKAFTEVRYELS